MNRYKILNLKTKEVIYIEDNRNILPLLESLKGLEIAVGLQEAINTPDYMGYNQVTISLDYAVKELKYNKITEKEVLSDEYIKEYLNHLPKKLDEELLIRLGELILNKLIVSQIDAYYDINGYSKFQYRMNELKYLNNYKNRRISTNPELEDIKDWYNRPIEIFRKNHKLDENSGDYYNDTKNIISFEPHRCDEYLDTPIISFKYLDTPALAVASLNTYSKYFDWLDMDDADQQCRQDKNEMNLLHLLCKTKFPKKLEKIQNKPTASMNLF